MSAEAYANKGDYYVHILGLHSGVDVRFKGFLTNFSDSWATKFNSEEVYGRMDPIMTFQNTTRKLTIDFDVPSNDGPDATNNLAKLSQLAASQYPGFASAAGGASTISTAPLHKIKFANWVTAGGQIGDVSSNGLVVAMEGVTFAPNLDAGVLEIGPKLIPKLFTLSLSMTVLHTEQVGWNLGFWMGNQNYPYTERADPLAGGMSMDPGYSGGSGMSMEDEGGIGMTSIDAPMSISPSEEEYQSNEVYQESVEEEILGPGMTSIDAPMSDYNY
jgi:hypothetical protein